MDVWWNNYPSCNYLESSNWNNCFSKNWCFRLQVSLFWNISILISITKNFRYLKWRVSKSPYIRLFWGVVFPYIRAYIGEDSSILGTWTVWWTNLWIHRNYSLKPNILCVLFRRRSTSSDETPSDTWYALCTFVYPLQRAFLLEISSRFISGSWLYPFSLDIWV